MQYKCCLIVDWVPYDMTALDPHSFQYKMHWSVSEVDSAHTGSKQMTLYIYEIISNRPSYR